MLDFYLSDNTTNCFCVTSVLCSLGMNELDEVWTQMMQSAIQNARSTGRTDVAEYLALKAGNDQIRATSCRWLFESFTELSDEVNRKGIRLNIENQNPHRFAVGHSTM